METIALVDDDQTILATVAMALKNENFKVKTYSDPTIALSELIENPPDLAVFDMKMPRMDGLELLRRFREKSQTPVIFLTSKDAELDELFGLKMGADDYIRKPFSQKLLVERIRAVIRRSAARKVAAVQRTTSSGEGHDSESVIQAGDLVLQSDSHTCTWKGQEIVLTVSEFLILEILARRPGLVRSRDAIINFAYEDDGLVDDRTIDSHIKRLRKKFRDFDPEFNRIETLYGIGYRYKAD